MGAKDISGSLSTSTSKVLAVAPLPKADYIEAIGQHSGSGAAFRVLWSTVRSRKAFPKEVVKAGLGAHPTAPCSCTLLHTHTNPMSKFPNLETDMAH